MIPGGRAQLTGKVSRSGCPLYSQLQSPLGPNRPLLILSTPRPRIPTILSSLLTPISALFVKGEVVENLCFSSVSFRDLPASCRTFSILSTRRQSMRMLTITAHYASRLDPMVDGRMDMFVDPHGPVPLAVVPHSRTLSSSKGISAMCLLMSSGVRRT